MVLDTRFSLAQILQAAVLLATVSCNDCNGDDNGGPPVPPPETNPAIASVEILPAQISVMQGTTFVVRARVKDKWGNILPDDRASAVHWTSSPEITVAEGPSATVVVNANPTAPPPIVISLIAFVQGVDKRDTSTITVTAPNATGSYDWLASEYAANSPPSFAFLTGPSSYGEPLDRVNSLVSVVKEGQLAPFACATPGSNCGVITLLAPGRAFSQVDVDWTSRCDIAPFVTGAGVPAGCGAITPTIPTPLNQPPHIKVVVWRVADAASVDNQIKADIVYAQSVFDQPYLGIKLDFLQQPYGNKHTSISHSGGCMLSDGTTPIPTELAAKGGVQFDSKTITAVYVDALNPGTGDDLGFTCPYDATAGTLILISADAITNSTLAHELGHALGQWSSGDKTHPDLPAPQLPGFDPSNLMWSSETDWYVSLRHNLTLGQLFQMNLADISFLKKAKIVATSGAGLSCSPDAASNTPCPPLAQDERQ